MNLLTVSVIIPAKNEELTISKCLDSILASDYPKEKMDVIVVVDGSTDNTLKIANKYKPRINVIKLKPQSCKASALNRVLKFAKGSIIGVFDSDCIVEPNCISNSVKKFANKNVSGVSGALLSHNKDSIIAKALSLETTMISFFQHVFTTKGRSSMFMGKNMFIRKKILLEVGGFDEYTFSEDLSLSLKMWEKNYKIDFEPKSIAYHEEPSSIKSFVNQRKRWCRGSLRVMRSRKYKNINGFLDDVQRGVYFYIAPFGAVVMALYFLLTFMNLQFLTLPFASIWLIGVGAMVYSRIFFKQSLKDFIAFPLWFLLSNLHIPILIYSAIQEATGKKMQWYKAERK